MNRQKTFELTTLFLATLALGGCVSSTTKYRDTSKLEQPPTLDVAAKESGSSAEDSETKAGAGLADDVSLVDESHLILNRPFDVAWKLVGKALELSEMEISDRNREKGHYYVIFDPDTAEQKNGETSNLFMDFFVSNKYPQGRYLISFSENPRSVKLSVEFLEQTESDHSTQDGYSEFTATDNGVAKLLKKLYSTLHDDSPAN